MSTTRASLVEVGGRLTQLGQSGRREVGPGDLARGQYVVLAVELVADRPERLVLNPVLDDAKQDRKVLRVVVQRGVDDVVSVALVDPRSPAVFQQLRQARARVQRRNLETYDLVGLSVWVHARQLRLPGTGGA